MAMKQSPIPGFRALTDQILVRPGLGDDDEAASKSPVPAASQPSTVVIYGWGDGLPRHVAKFAEGYRAMFPRAKQILVLSPLRKALFSTLQQRTDMMVPVVKELFPQGPPPASDDKDRPLADRSVLLHTISNGGGINLAATLNVYRRLYGKPLPFQLLVMDSTPGGTDLTWGNLIRWSRAVAYGVARFLPLPFVFTQSLCAIFVLFNHLLEMLRRTDSAGAWSRKAVKDETYKIKTSRNLYLYSKEDDLIYYQDIEKHAAETTKAGWTSDIELFKGSGHVDHMRKNPEQYWQAIAKSWQKAVEGTR